MKTKYKNFNSTNWRPQARFHANLDSIGQLKDFNDNGGVGVFIDFNKKNVSNIKIVGSLTGSVCFWETQSRSGFVTRPKFSADLLTLRFVTEGRVTYLRRDGEFLATESIAALTEFDEILEVCAPSAVSAVSATIAVASLVSAYDVLVGGGHRGLPALEPIAEMTRPGMSGLLSTIRLVQRRLQDLDHEDDLLLPLFQEVISYQLLSAWPKRAGQTILDPPEPPSKRIRLAIDYIQANLSVVLMLADVAAAVGISVRSLQDKFKKELGITPIQYIIEQRLTRAHVELASTAATDRSISDIARSWGFSHMGDFGQRYRRLFGCTPSQTRRDASVTRSKRLS